RRRGWRRRRTAGIEGEGSVGVGGSDENVEIERVASTRSTFSSLHDENVEWDPRSRLNSTFSSSRPQTSKFPPRRDLARRSAATRSLNASR
ncbi:MAG TPA: hypothetical protein VK631_07205, partial [Solirubrobacteraceae bacterium]|nr:hypothetical protein [Solirubrobacteraceae bacterium]